MRLSAWLALILALLLLAGCGKPALYQQESYVFGTRVQISIYGLSDAEASKHAAAVLGDLDRLHARLHAWQPSEITRLNAAIAAGQSYTVDAELRDLLLLAQDVARRSDQLFNPAVGRLVEVWGFHKDTFAPVRPDAGQLRALLARQPSLEQLEINGLTVRSGNPAVQLDLGGFAKGWALDRAATYLRANGVRNALINIGGNVLALGHKGDQDWTVGIQHPRQAGAMASVALQDGEAIGTSGDYQRFFERDGVRYSHLIDPRTGEPARDMMAATVIVPAGALAGTYSDVAGKPLFIGGVGSASGFAKRFGIRDVLLVDAQGDVYLTSGMQQRLHWLQRPAHVRLLP
ncbi:FAD:protein FMN transferase [Chitinilyticum piscinae]|uniref:FAD:protein FMN transferase n=1 Tax=Chitinilyticum piscinae TaxID=2866724 RepID=A0A8J7FEX9_9NEIS|nr:FAD:protein FMN transferase [Chitinilyticum piscinae]MBE9607780.1 FAD:protein FMN transferase [Chitinilyticum piscinae]